MSNEFNKELVDFANEMASMPKVNPFEYETVKCPECGKEDFIPAMRFKKIPGILIGQKEDAYYPHKVFLCKNCGELSPISKYEMEEIMKMTKQEEKKSNIIV